MSAYAIGPVIPATTATTAVASALLRNALEPIALAASRVDARSRADGELSVDTTREPTMRFSGECARSRCAWWSLPCRLAACR